jgi:uncharacterized protein (TIRG00374 family)
VTWVPPADPILAAAPQRSPDASPRASRSVLIGVSVVVSGFCLYAAMRGTNLREIGSTLAAANLWLALPLLATQVLFFALKAFRWRLLLAPVRPIASGRLVAPMMVGFMGNNLLPARLGELIRLHLGARLLRIAHAQVLATLVLERLFDFLAVLALFTVGATALRDVPQSLVSAGYVSAGLSAVALAGTTFYVGATPTTLRWAQRITRWCPDRLALELMRQLELAASGMGALRRPRLLAGIVIASLLQWVLMAACVYLSFLAVGVEAPMAAGFVVLAATVLGVMVPAAPGFFGTLHLAFVLALTPFGVPENRAMAAAVFYHIIPYVGVVLSGAYFAQQLGIRFRGIERDVIETESAA